MNGDERVDHMLADMERVERIRVFLCDVFKTQDVVLTVAWNGESFEELYRRDVKKRMLAVMREHATSGRRYGYRDRKNL